jgi:hypothetical protein
MAYERVIAVWNWHDGPRTGVADYDGRPHHFSCEFDEQEDEYSNTYLLSPVDEQALSLVHESQAIWQQWELAFHRGEVTLQTHPALPGQNPRFAELHEILDSYTASAGTRIRVKGEFRWLSREVGLRTADDLEVQWSEPT